MNRSKRVRTPSPELVGRQRILSETDTNGGKFMPGRPFYGRGGTEAATGPNVDCRERGLSLPGGYKISGMNGDRDVVGLRSADYGGGWRHGKRSDDRRATAGGRSGGERVRRSDGGDFDGIAGRERSGQLDRRLDVGTDGRVNGWICFGGWSLGLFGRYLLFVRLLIGSLCRCCGSIYLNSPL
ncbi:hypothetical protein GWI33_002879 [Rhynchophorus ferrugineus]|uniref:Uncharacterized protein n=1 Tax=Rhynchophorus ferrugineus TaxID=354439 RepID=A0A834IK29_RHYFE|nr:hypothetical protein GWI33_002879 [Rhynchophorus ferrugineus]